MEGIFRGAVPSRCPILSLPQQTLHVVPHLLLCAAMGRIQPHLSKCDFFCQMSPLHSRAD